MPDQMTAAELRVLREHLGLTAESLAEVMDVQLRTVRRWEHGHSPVPDGAAEEIRTIRKEADALVALYVGRHREDGDPVMVTFADNHTYTSLHPESPWPASWHRAIAGRVADLVPGLRLEFAPTAER